MLADLHELLSMCCLHQLMSFRSFFAKFIGVHHPCPHGITCGGANHEGVETHFPTHSSQVTGGRNGYGAKLANIFSTEFTVETCDGKRERKYKQTFKDNMGTKGQPKITTCKVGAANSFTKSLHIVKQKFWTFLKEECN